MIYIDGDYADPTPMIEALPAALDTAHRLRENGLIRFVVLRRWQRRMWTRPAMGVRDGPRCSGRMLR